MTGEWAEELNQAQREAATAGDGPLLVIAGAGTGKTKTLVCRLAYLLEKGVPPERILLLTFTRRAAAQMLRRAEQLVGGTSTGRIWGGTFHATANRLLRIYGQAINLTPEFTVMDQADAGDMMGLIRSELGLAKKIRRFPRKDTLVRIYSHTVNAQTGLSDVLRNHYPWCQEETGDIARAFAAYTKRKQDHHVLDYDDLLLYWRVLACASPAANQVADRFEHILVDEYQDTNSIQAAVLQGMRRTCKNVMAVGDDAQSIYSFRAATIRNILDFPQQFDNTRVITLETNYRSTQPILQAANTVMEQATERYTKNLWSSRKSDQKPILTTCLNETEQADTVCRNILEHYEAGVPLQRQAVLFRAAHHSADLEVELSRRNIPFHKFGGLKFVEAAHVKDMLAFLRVMENPYDAVSWFRVLQLLHGIGPHRATRILTDIGAAPGSGIAADTNPETRTSPLHRLLADPPKVAPALREQFQELRGMLSDCIGFSEADNSTARADDERKASDSDPEATHDRDAPTPVPLIAQLERIRRFYEPRCLALYENGQSRLRGLDQLEQIASGYRSRRRFVTDLTLDPPAATSDLAGPPDLDEDFLTLSTIHSAKGCEWKVVHIIHAADGNIPSDMATGDQETIDEERRMFYVAMTRAEDELHIYCPLRYYHRRHASGDGHGYAQLTRFVTPDVRVLLEERAAPGAEAGLADDAPIPHRQNAADAVADALKDLWDR